MVFAEKKRAREGNCGGLKFHFPQLPLTMAVAEKKEDLANAQGSEG